MPTIERVAALARSQQHVDVSGMQQIEDAVREDHDPPPLPPPGTPFLKDVQDLPRRGANAQKTLSTCGLKSISCCFHGRSTTSMYSLQIQI